MCVYIYIYIGKISDRLPILFDDMTFLYFSHLFKWVKSTYWLIIKKVSPYLTERKLEHLRDFRDKYVINRQPSQKQCVKINHFFLYPHSILKSINAILFENDFNNGIKYAGLLAKAPMSFHNLVFKITKNIWPLVTMMWSISWITVE